MNITPSIAPPQNKVTQLDDYLAFAHELADAAAQVTLKHFRTRLAVNSKSDATSFDPVTIADRDSETAIRKLIDARFPAHGILGEEHGEKHGTTKQWVIDPIDGTRAFISGMPSWGTLIALNNSAHVQLGIMDQPFTGERFFAHADSPSILRHGGQEIILKTRPCDKLKNAVLATTTPALFDGTPAEEIWTRLTKIARLTRYGGDCYNYALLAAGHVDAVLEQTLNPYDIQALIPIIEQAGGVITDWQGGTAMHGGQAVACGDKYLHDELLALLNA